ncbi:hepatocyte growth factor-like protein [Amphiura filiformis]|uniref:hepatocyte growth factor-like protein n=1 Tax=Amphiura filiformis TaxID=82378 RepID=UPI003B2182FF
MSKTLSTQKEVGKNEKQGGHRLELLDPTTEDVLYSLTPANQYISQGDNTATMQEVMIPSDAHGPFTMRLLRQAAQWGGRYYFKSCADIQVHNCYFEPLGRDYRGSIHQTIDLKECQSWTAKDPHNHTRTPENYPHTGLGEHNYCRNPDNEPGGPWCYTTDPETRWAYCPVHECNSTGKSVLGYSS